MKNRLSQKLKEAKSNKSKLFCAYITLGYPSLATTERMIIALEKAGTDIIELGFPFSDPLADGPTIQWASSEAIKKGVDLPTAFRLIKSLRKKGLKIPVLLFSYLNPIMHYGISSAIKHLHQNGFDGLIIPDLPHEEGRMWKNWFKQSNQSIVYLAAPTSTDSRLKDIVRESNGFVYYVSLKGVTGSRAKLPIDLIQKLKNVKKIAKDKPVLVGFGVSDAKQARAISKIADGIIVGSAIMNRLSHGKKGEAETVRFATQLIKAIKQV